VNKILAVAIKELRQAARDPFSLTLLLVLPVTLLLLYGFALNFDVRHVALALEDRDHSAASRELVQAFVRSTYFDLRRVLPAGADAAALFERREAQAVLVVPQRFGADLAAGLAPRLQLLLDGSDAQSATTILGYAQGVVADRNVRVLAEALGVRDAAELPGVSYEPRVWYNPDLRSTEFLVPGLIGFILMLTAVVATALSLVRERERGTLEQLRITALRPAQLVVGKLVPYLGISLAATAIILGAAQLVFGVTIRGTILDLFLATLVYLVGALGWGLFVSTIAANQAMAFQIGVLSSMLPAIFLSGFIFPLRTLPLPLYVLSHVVPARYYLVVLRGVVLKGASLAAYADQMAFLGMFALAVMGVAWVRLLRQEA
jgi:drug efflux transport system permease protein